MTLGVEKILDRKLTPIARKASGKVLIRKPALED
jgi:hypothetical protein